MRAMNIEEKAVAEYVWDLPTNFVAQIQNMVELLIIQVDRRQPNDFSDPDDLLMPYWYKVIEDYRIDHEHLFRYERTEDAYADIKLWWREHEEVTRAYKNAKKWIEKARADFKELVRPYSWLMRRCIENILPIPTGAGKRFRTERTRYLCCCPKSFLRLTKFMLSFAKLSRQ
jgi:hypothetical protein